MCMGPENPGHTDRKLKGIRPEFSGGLFLPVCKTAPDRSPILRQSRFVQEMEMIENRQNKTG